MIHKTLTAAMLAFMLIISYAGASYITLETAIVTNPNSISVSITNKGDEPAYNVQPSLLSPIVASIAVKQRLEINEKQTSMFDIELPDALPGTYPVILNIDYADANNYPFSAIATSTFINKESTNPGLIMALEPIKLSGSNKLKLSVKNLDDYKKDIEIMIIAPKELTVEDRKQLSLKARASDKPSFKIEDFSARPDSTYAVFAIAEYDKDGRHYTSITSSTVKIVKRLNIPISILSISLAVLLVIYIVYKVRKRNESKHNHPDTK